MKYNVIFWNVQRLGEASSNEKKEVFMDIFDNVAWDVMCIVELSDKGEEVLSGFCEFATYDFLNTNQQNLNYGTIVKTINQFKVDNIMEEIGEKQLLIPHKYNTRSGGKLGNFGPRPVGQITVQGITVLFTHAPAYDDGGKKVIKGIKDWMEGPYSDQRVLALGDFNTQYKSELGEGKQVCCIPKAKNEIAVVSPGETNTHKKGNLLDYALCKGIYCKASPITMTTNKRNKMFKYIDHLPIRYEIC